MPVEYVTTTGYYYTSTTVSTYPTLVETYTTSPTAVQYTNRYYVGTGLITSVNSTTTGWYNIPAYHQSIVVPKRPKIDYRAVRKKRDYTRKALWKSIRFFESMFGINDIKLFMNGGSFDIEGRHFDYRISKGYFGLIEHTANPNNRVVPYNLDVYSKQGLHLFRGCTVFKDTPIIDQITALIMHIKSGEEERLIKNMNLSRIFDLRKDANSIALIESIKGENYQHLLLRNL